MRALWALGVFFLFGAFALSDEERLFGAVGLGLESPGLLTAADEALRFSLFGGLGDSGRVRLEVLWQAPGLALGGGLGWPRWGFVQGALAQDGAGVAAYLDPFRARWGLGAGYAEREVVWAWLEGSGARVRLRAYYRRPAARGRALFGMEGEPGRSLRLFGYYGERRTRGGERLRLWGGGEFVRGAGTAGFLLSLAGRWQSPIFGGPLAVDLLARGSLGLSQSGGGELAFVLRPLSLRADWVYRLEGGELRLYLPFVRLSAGGDGVRFELAAGVSGWLALPLGRP